MDLSSIGVQIVALAAATVAAVQGLRSAIPAFHGWRTVLLVLLVAAVLCVALSCYEHGMDAWWRGMLQSVVVWIVALGGDSWAKRIASKAAGDAP
jgi:hypothetical protein